MKPFAKKLTAVTVLVFAALVGLSACVKSIREEAPSDTSEDTSAEEDIQTPDVDAEAPAFITVTDHLDKQITVPRDLERIVVCDIYPLPSVLSVFFDSAEKIVGMPKQSMTAAKNGLLGQLYPEILGAVTDYIDGTSVNIESLMALEPDVVFYSSGTPQIGEQCEKVGIPAVAISAGKWEYDAVETLDHWIETLSVMFPENDKTDTVAAYSKDVYERVQQRIADIPDAEKQRIFFLFQYSDSMIATSGRHFFGQYWADAVGAVNVGEELDTDKSTGIGMEQIYVWNPDIILITNYNTAKPADIIGNTVGSYDWSPIKAVTDGKVYKMPLGMYRSYTCGVDTPVTLLWIAKTVYPAYFEDIDIIAETKAYYESVFGITLTDEQAVSIFAPAAEAAAFNG